MCIRDSNTGDGCLPSDLATGSEREIEEEMRLLYVAMTRARDHLDLLIPQRFYVSGQSGSGDRHVYASRSRFIPNRLLPHFQQITWPEAAKIRRAPALVPIGPMATIEVNRRMKFPG